MKKIFKQIFVIFSCIFCTCVKVQTGNLTDQFTEKFIESCSFIEFE